MKNIPAICSGRDVFCRVFRRAHTGAWGIYAGLPRVPLIICEALRIPKKLLIGDGNIKQFPPGFSKSGRQMEKCIHIHEFCMFMNLSTKIPKNRRAKNEQKRAKNAQNACLFLSTEFSKRVGAGFLKKTGRKNGNVHKLH